MTTDISNYKLVKSQIVSIVDFITILAGHILDALRNNKTDV